jgi:NAD(P)-dependent dehydrogenase (short-subunit alcohol dehydrogenase family)
VHLDNTAAIVTGAASGLGAATAAHLADRGATVYGLDLEKAVACVVPSAGVHLVPADVTDDEQVRAAVGRIRYHGQQLRLAVNCAGIAPSARILSRNGPHDLDLFHNVLKVNLLGTFNVLRLAAEAMSELTPDDRGQRGVIINTAARDLAQYGIRVITIAPGIVDTPMMAGFTDEVRAGLAATVPFPRRLAASDEYARLVSVIAEHDYLNGEVIRMDGALRMAAR